MELAEPTVALLVDRTEGWAAGLLLAALSLAGHSYPEGFAAEFSGTERTVAEYLLAGVLARQGEQVRLLLLLRTSILDSVKPGWPGRTTSPVSPADSRLASRGSDDIVDISGPFSFGPW